jgi:hypothetical protein
MEPSFSTLRTELHNEMIGAGTSFALEDLTQTDVWEYSVERGKPSTESAFSYDPPITPDMASPSDRILVTGTNAEVDRIMRDIPIDGTPVYQSHIRRFWKSFFGTDDYANPDEPRTIPQKIVATGYMRNTDAFDSYTKNVAGRLEEIARRWDVPIEFVPASAYGENTRDPRAGRLS